MLEAHLLVPESSELRLCLFFCEISCLDVRPLLGHPVWIWELPMISISPAWSALLMLWAAHLRASLSSYASCGTQMRLRRASHCPYDAILVRGLATWPVFRSTDRSQLSDWRYL